MKISDKISAIEKRFSERHPLFTQVIAGIVVSIIISASLWLYAKARPVFSVIPKKVASAGELLLKNDGLLPIRNKSYAIATSNTVMIDPQYEKYATLTTTQDKNVKILDVVSVAGGAVVRLNYEGSSSINIKPVGGNTVMLSYPPHTNNEK